MLDTHVFSDHETLSQYTADVLAARLRRRPDALICLATGATPMRTYELLVDMAGEDPELFAEMRVIKLDEWGGLTMVDPASCEQHLRRALVEPLGLNGRYVSFDCDRADAVAECRRIARWLEQHGPIDTCVLGLGINGHIGFNEPASVLEPHAHVARLSEASLAHAMLDNSLSRPLHGLTLGMADLLHARQALLLASGESKREPIKQLLTGPISTEFPASLLSLHSNIALVCDTAAVAPDRPGRIVSWHEGQFHLHSPPAAGRLQGHRKSSRSGSNE